MNRFDYGCDDFAPGELAQQHRTYTKAVADQLNEWAENVGPLEDPGGLLIRAAIDLDFGDIDTLIEILQDAKKEGCQDGEDFHYWFTESLFDPENN